MKKMIPALLACIMIAACTSKKESPQSTSSTTINVVPLPAAYSVDATDVLTIPNAITIVAKSEDEINVASFLKEYLSTKGIEASVNANPSDATNISLLTSDDASLNKEAYDLTCDAKGISIAANSGAGLFYGAQSLIQLIHSNEGILPYMTIQDQPRFSYRGLMLDVGRHMFPVEFIKKYIDLMSRYKFNTFHWHLTEDQGWRIEIKKYPKLQEVAAYRNETVVGHASTKTRSEAEYDGQKYGGYYTQEEIKDVVAYASARYITVIPEIEMPGHSQAALTAYPYLGCTGGPYHVATSWGVFDEVYCAGKETTFEFLEDVIDEVVELFPGKYIHIGGDESPKAKWEKCPNCQKRIKAEGLKDEHALQSYFIQRMEKYINSKGKSIIGWDEILEGGLAANATVMSWRGEEGGIAAAQQNHNVIMTPTGWCYLDYYQADPKNEPLAIGGFLPIDTVYSYDPLPTQLSPDQQKYILGGQCNLWTEYIPTPEQCEYMVYPRAIAMAEVLWSPKETRNFDKFAVRLKSNKPLLDLWNVNYAKHIFTDSIK